MPLLIEATIEGTLHRISIEPVELDHFWYPYVVSFDAPNLDTATQYGGFCKITFGSISLSPDLFLTHWLPPDKISLVIKYTETTEAEAVEVFTVIGYLSKIDNEYIAYDIREAEYETRCLATCTELSGNEDVPVPRVIGTVEHAEPVRVYNAALPEYRIDGIDLTNPAYQIKSIDYSTLTHTRITTFEITGFSNGDIVEISDTKNFDGLYVISGTYPGWNTFLIEKAYDTGSTGFEIDGFFPYPQLSEIVNPYLEDWTGADCDGWTFEPAGTTTMEREETPGLVCTGTSSVKISFDLDGSYAKMSQPITTEVIAGCRGYIDVSFYVAWVSTSNLYATLIIGGSTRSTHVQSKASWQKIEFLNFEVQEDADYEIEIIFGGSAFVESDLENQILYVDGPFVVNNTTYNTWTKINFSQEWVTLSPYYKIVIKDSYLGAYDGEHMVAGSTAGVAVIATNYAGDGDGGYEPVAFYADRATFSTKGIGHVIWSETVRPFKIYDNGIPITNNYVSHSGSSYQAFNLSAEPVGKVTISGSSTEPTLEDVMTSAAAAMGLTLNTDSARIVSPSMSTTVTSQMTIIDFISSICAFYSHMAYIVGTTLYLIDCKRVNQIAPDGLSLSEFNSFSVEYSGRCAYLKQIKSEWSAPVLTVLAIVGDYFYSLENEERTVELNITSVAAGSVTSEATGKLTDRTATFITDGVTTAMYVKKSESGDIVTITSVDSETQLSVGSDIFETDDDYTIGERFPSGTEESVTPFHNEVTNVKDALSDIQSMLMSQKIEIQIPMDASRWVLPGMLLFWTDTGKIADISAQMKVRSLKYDFDNYTVIASGEGSIS